MRTTKILIFAALLSILACKDNGEQDYLPASVGGLNTLTVVMDNELWDSSVGDRVRGHFAAPVVGVTFDEALFSITQIPPQIFKGSVQNSRSVLYVVEDTVNVAHMKTNMYAKPQKIGVVKGADRQELIANLDKVASDFIEGFKENEIKEAQQRFLKSLNKETALQQTLGIDLDVPSAYTVGRQEEGFVWLDRQIKTGTMNIIAYAVPNDYFATDSTFVKDIISMRDSIGGRYIPGEPISGKENHMITERAFSPYVFPAEVGGRKAAEVRGMWEMSAYPMAGPFVTYIINDKPNDRKIILEGFTFAPATPKRDYMFELEAILKTIRFMDADDQS